jgi:hypothetical protein
VCPEQGFSALGSGTTKFGAAYRINQCDDLASLFRAINGLAGDRKPRCLDSIS